MIRNHSEPRFQIRDVLDGRIVAEADTVSDAKYAVEVLYLTDGEDGPLAITDTKRGVNVCDPIATLDGDTLKWRYAGGGLNYAV